MQSKTLMTATMVLIFIALGMFAAGIAFLVLGLAPIAKIPFGASIFSIFFCFVTFFMGLAQQDTEKREG